jgi:hypothetical protein
MPIRSRIFPGLPCTSFKVSNLILRSLIHFELILIQSEQHGSSFRFLHADDQFSQQHLLMKLSFSIICFWQLCQKLRGHSYMDSDLGFLLCSIDLHVCFCANTVMFLLLWFCSIVWSLVLWYLQCCSFCLVLPSLFMVFYAAKWILG